MRFRNGVVLLTCCILAGGLTAPSVIAAEATPPMEARVDTLLKATADYLKQAKAFTFHAEITTDAVLAAGERVQFAAAYDAAVKRPNKVKTRFRGDVRDNSAYYDGKKFTVLNHDSNFFARWDAPSSIDKLIEKLEEKLGVNIPLSSLFLSDPYVDWKDGVESGTYAGKHLVYATPCHHLVLTQADVDVQVWIEEGNQLVLRKVVMTFKKRAGSPQLTAHFTEWDFAPRLADLIFDFVPPDGAARIDFLPSGE